jgi:anti-sigma B factor antagonist
VILDLSGVPYVDSTALGALVAAYVSLQKAGRRVVLSGVSERVLRMLKITRVESLFLTFPTLEDAIGGLAKHPVKKRSLCPRNEGKYALARN